MRIVLLTRFHPGTHEFIARLLARGIKLQEVIFEGQPREGIRLKIARVAEGIFLRLSHRLFLGRHPAAETVFYRRFGSVPRLLREHRVKWSVVDNHNDQRSMEIIRAEHPELLVLCGTRIIKPDVLKLPSAGTLNIHSSLLPRFRGGKAEFWILFSGEHAANGVTVHWAEPGLDTGPVVLQEHIPVAADDTPATLRAKAQYLAPVLLCEAIRRLSSGEQLRFAQDENKATRCKVPTPEEIAQYRRRFPGRPVF